MNYFLRDVTPYFIQVPFGLPPSPPYKIHIVSYDPISQIEQRDIYDHAIPPPSDFSDFSDVQIFPVPGLSTSKKKLTMYSFSVFTAPDPA